MRSTQKALDDVCRAALAVPADHAEWCPMAEARSVLSQMQEIATSGAWFLPIIRDGKPPEFDAHARREALRLRQSFDTVEKCVEAARQSMSELCAAISSFPDDHLEQEVHMPFGGGVSMTMADILSLPSWNMVYHLGQINQIQLMLGDREMH
ncbi:hypothetical protein OP10G_0030 [Fimbriimonas ginsengisoli Gsoil 348]|uniref:DinB-like domain-containing protein n=1 Tax=Fimbriimonas ginsengisoli Gsoil 348 TaxID=661478 RepID=A0A068NIF9_FIMGI|nr:hypothetical protein OP10G_0030 [Fimbriimonas ginsengisoli Gsoil 348]